MHPGRFTADIDGDFVVFLIGMRFNKPLKVHKWLPVATAMPKMLKAIDAHPEMGCLGYQQWVGRTTMLVQYWRDFESLDRFARDKDLPHLEPWRRFNRAIRNSGDVGIWHETYRVRAGEYEAITGTCRCSGWLRQGVTCPLPRKRTPPRPASARRRATTPRSSPTDLAERDWHEWHRAYEEPGSPLTIRLALVQGRICDVLDNAPPGPIQAISACAGQGRDLLGVLIDHPRRDDVCARLVELDPDLADTARTTARDAALSAVDVVTGDASTTSAFVGAVPAELVLFCGVFGNVSDDDIHRTISYLPMLCAPGGTVIWTRHRRDPDLTPTVRAWFGDTGFEEVGFDAPDEVYVGVGAHRLVAPPKPFEPGVRLFSFTTAQSPSS